MLKLKTIFSMFKFICLICISRILRHLYHSNWTHLDHSNWGFDVNSQGHLEIGGCDVVELSRLYGTPTFVANEQQLRKNCQAFLQAFNRNYTQTEVFYSYKTNPVPEILSLIHEEGLGAEVISPYELWLSLKLGVSGNRIVYNGPYKNPSALELAVDKEIRLINIDSFEEIKHLTQIAELAQKSPNVGVRVYTGVGWESKFGLNIDSGEALKAYTRLAELDRFNICGIHTHLGTSINKTSHYRQAIKKIISFMKTLRDKLAIEIPYLDIGGGFAVPTVRSFMKGEHYLPYPLVPFLKKPPRIEEFSAVIAEEIEIGCRKYGLMNPSLFIEPGRAITSSAQILLLSVALQKEKSNGTRYIVADGGTNLAYPLPWEYHELFVANRMFDDCSKKYTVVGPLCTPGDCLYRRKILPSVSANDILAIMDTGSYFIPYINTFSFPRPGIVLTSNGNHWLVRKHEEFDDVTALDTIFLRNKYPHQAGSLY